jgi:hypothetical protein
MKTTKKTATAAAKKTITKKGVPPNSFSRNSFGLLETVDYTFTDEGLIDWRKMIEKKYLYANPDYFPDGTSIDGLRDNQLIFTLEGLKKLAKIRGYESVEYVLSNSRDGGVLCVCKIVWLPNYETEGRTIVHSSTASANFDNTTSFMTNYLAECAENRSFARAIRTFLNLNIVSREELGKKKKQNRDQKAEAKVQAPGSTFELGPDPVDFADETTPTELPYEKPQHLALRRAMSQKNLSFEKIKKSCVLRPDDFPGAGEWTEISDIPARSILQIIAKLKKTS